MYLLCFQPEEKPREPVENQIIDTGGKKAKPQRRRRQSSRVTNPTYNAQVCSLSLYDSNSRKFSIVDCKVVFRQAFD